MAPRGQDMNATSFVAADVIGSEGIGQHGELLLDATAAAYPDELQAVQNYRPNDELNEVLFGKGYDARLGVHGKIAKITGLDGLELGDTTIPPERRVLRAVVRGGADEVGRNRDSSQAWISYVALDDTGDNNFKGVFPFLDLEKGKTDRHFSQLRAAAETPAGRQHLQARLKQAEAEGDSSASARRVDPIAALADAKASELVALMEEHPDQVETIKAFERATHGDKARTTVLEFEPEGFASDGDGQGDGQDQREGGEAEPSGGGGDGGGDAPPAP